MVRFSDMLGGNGEPEDPAATDSPYAALAGDEPEPEADAEPDDEETAGAVQEPVPISTNESPEAVLDRLTQIAASARAADPVTPGAPTVEPEVEPEVEPDPMSPVGDDFLPNERVPVRRRRGWKRHP